MYLAHLNRRLSGELIENVGLGRRPSGHWLPTADSSRAGVILAKKCALSTGKLPRRLAQEQCG